MSPNHILSLYDAEKRGRADQPPPGFTFAWSGPVFRMIGPDRGAHSNAVLCSRLDEASAPSVIADEIRFFDEQGRSFEWKHFSHDAPSHLKELLAAAGLQAEEAETFVALDVAGDAEFRDPPPGVEIRRMDDPADFGVIATVNEAVYGDAEHARWLAGIIGEEKRARPNDVTVYAAVAQDKPVSVGWMRYSEGDAFGSLWGGATLAEWRGKGIYSALVGARVREARNRGCRWLTVDCSPMSLPILERRGFVKLATITPFIWTSRREAGDRS